MARLRIVDGDGSEQVVDLTGTRLQVGRGRDNNIVLPDPEKGVSRVHAELRYENGHYVVVDLQSQNGTWINGRRVERAELPYGAELAIGAYRLTLLSDRPAAVRAAPTARAADPLDDIRPTERYDGPIVAAKADAPRSSRGLVVGTATLVLVAALATLAWVWPGAHPADAARPTSLTPGAAGVSTAAAPGAVTAGSAPAERTEPAYASDPAPKRSADRGGAAARTDPARRPGESNEAWRSRAAALQTRYGYSKAALERGDFAAAAGGFDAILLEEPGFLDAPRLLIQAQAGLRANARSMYDAGKKLDEAGDWVGALQKYEQARQIHAGLPGLSESVQRARANLRAAGIAAFNQGRALEAGGRTQEALKEYEKAVHWLPPDDPNSQVARAKLQQLKRN